MDSAFDLVAASVPGRDHLGRAGLPAGGNNQDAWALRRCATGLAAVVCDGCSAGAHSEVGAQIGARLVIRAARRILLPLLADPAVAPTAVAAALERVRTAVLGRLARVGAALGGPPARVIHDALLFTVVLAAVGRGATAVASLGDGVIAINGAVRRLGPFPGNAPPYLAYGLPACVGHCDLAPAALRFRLEALLPTAALANLLIGTDGVWDLAQAAARTLPGRDAPVGPLSDLWTAARFVANPDAMRRHLALANREVARWDPRTQTLQRSPGLLPDDTTVAVVRRRRPEDRAVATVVPTGPDGVARPRRGEASR